MSRTPPTGSPHPFDLSLPKIHDPLKHGAMGRRFLSLFVSFVTTFVKNANVLWIPNMIYESFVYLRIHGSYAIVL